MAVDRVANISRAIDNYTRILVLVSEVIANPTQANVDSVVAAAGTSSTLNLLVNHTLDGQNYDFVGYQDFLMRAIEQLRKIEATISGPFEVRSRGRT